GICNIFVHNAFQPHRLPYTALRGIPHSVSVKTLFARTVIGCVRRIAYRNFQHVCLLFRAQVGYVKRKTVVASYVIARYSAVYKYSCYVVHRTEMQQNFSSVETFRKTELSAVMQIL